MKLYSKPLYDYLLQAGVLHGPPEAIALAKRAYRTLYKRNWKKQSRPHKELRIEVTLQQFDAIKRQAQINGLRYTTYARTVILASTMHSPAISRDVLLKVLQLVSMAAIVATTSADHKRISELLQKAEALLLEHLTP